MILLNKLLIGGRKEMFKLTKLLTVLVLASLLITACGGGETQTPVATEPPVTEMPATEAPT
jgi:hypothetical protein